jgi:S1-C subfamily serine protease
VPFDDDAADDVTGFRPPPHPDDRLWRHPSEVYAAEPATPLSSSGHFWPWGVIAAVGTAGVLLAGVGGLFLGGVRDRVANDRGAAEKVVTPLGSNPTAPLDGQTLSKRSSRGVTDIAEVARLADALAPDLVRIEGTSAAGSGVVLGTDGIVLTSATLVGDLHEIEVTLHGGQVVSGEVVGVDALTDIAVVLLPGKHGAAPYADPDELVAGEGLVTLGVADEGRVAMAAGPLSGTHGRVVRRDHPALEGLLHVATISQPAVLGGVVADQRGAVVGIVVWTDRNGTFATPVDVATKVANDLLDVGSVQHGWLGIDGYDRGARPAPTREVATAWSSAPSVPATTAATGVVVSRVDPDGPATDTLHTGDVIVGIDDQPVDDMGELTDELRQRSPGDTVEVTVEGDGDKTVEVTLDDRPTNP